MDQDLTIDDFLPLVGHTVQADADPEPLVLTVVSATPGKGRAHFRTPFTILFSSAEGHLLTPGIYTLIAEPFDTGRRFDVGLQPIACFGAPHYQAVFG